MKDWLRFTKREWWGVSTLTLLSVLAFCFYYLYEVKGAVGGDNSVFEMEMRAFAAEQERLQDSADAARQQCYGHFSRDSSKTGAWRKSKLQQYYEVERLDLNSCDSLDLLTVPQFGSKRAALLLAYRRRLGGFYSFEQVREVYGFQEMELAHLEKYFYLNRHKISKIKVNTATYKELISHPYFDAYLTKNILAYRERNGRIPDAETLQKCTHAYSELMEKLRPYLEYD